MAIAVAASCATEPFAVAAAVHSCIVPAMEAPRVGTAFVAVIADERIGDGGSFAVTVVAMEYWAVLAAS